MCITWPILLPINITGGNGKIQLELLSYSNIDVEKNSNRLYAHVAMAWLTYGFVLYMITRECIFYINLRQAYLLSPRSANLISSRTVLFTCVPEEFQDESRIRAVFGPTVKNVWVAGDTKVVDELVGARDKIAMQLEKTEVRYLKRVNRLYRKAEVKSEKQGRVFNPHFDVSPEDVQNARPKRRAGFLGLFGQRIDSIGFFRDQLMTANPKARAAQEAWAHGLYPKVSAIFVEFHTHTEAQTAYQLVTHHHGFRMAPKYIGVRPDEVIWPSLSMSWWRRVICQYLVYAFIAALIVFWAIPVGVFGILAQISVIQSLPGLTWISLIPEVS